MIKSLFLVLSVSFAFAAPHGWPGITPKWSSAKKKHVGTAYTWSQSKHKSLVWFTSAQGVLTETYFPTIDQAQIKDSQILVVDNKELIEERTQTKKLYKTPNASQTLITNIDHRNRFEITHDYFIDPQTSTLIDEVTIDAKKDGLDFYLLVNPHLNNTGYMDSGFIQNQELNFYEGKTSLKVASSTGFEKLSLGYVGHSDGFQDLAKNFKMTYEHGEIFDGNIAGTAKIKVPSVKGQYKLYISYQFNQDFNAVTNKTAQRAKAKYHQAWSRYFQSLKTPTFTTKKDRDLYLKSLYVLRVHEDKLSPGALIASLSKPWGDELYEQEGVFTGGYHLIWPRDLYHVAQALMESGDFEPALRALRFLKRIQYKSGYWNYTGRRIAKKGAFPQNTWTNGEEYWSGLQLDQVAYPIHVFYKLYISLPISKRSALMSEFKSMLKNAADFIQNYGPWTAQERWEENFGISPSSFAAAASSLIMIDKLLPGNGYKTTAMSWLEKPQDNIHTWTLTTNGKYSKKPYYIRIGGCDYYTSDWDPNTFKNCHIANSARKMDQRDILDQGFLKLSLLGLVPANNESILHSQKLVHKHLRVKTPNGYGWYRYTKDAYGEDGRGRLWPLLTSEHARFEIEKYSAGMQSWGQTQSKLRTYKASYHGFSNEGLLLPEQIFEKTGKGTGAATPLAWSHAEYVKLLWSQTKKTNIENLLRRQ